MKTTIILVMHGVPPNDFPNQDLAEFFGLQARLKRDPGAEKGVAAERYSELDKKIKNWPRTAANDPFYFASQELAGHLGNETGKEVFVGYNEFCAPEVTQALQEAVNGKAEQIILVTPMMTRGGQHAEVEIPALIRSFRDIHPEIKMIYAWPFDIHEVASFLADHIEKFMENKPEPDKPEPKAGPKPIDLEAGLD